MPQSRQVFGTINTPRNQPWVGAPIIFSYSPYSVNANTIFIPQRISVITDSLGRFEVELWCNEQGDYASKYNCLLPNSDSFDFVLPLGSEPIALEVLRQGGIVPTNPQYQTLLTYVASFQGYRPARDIFTVAATPQTSFTLSTNPGSPHLAQVFLNGVLQTYGVDYNFNANILNWLSAIALKPNWTLEVYY